MEVIQMVNDRLVSFKKGILQCDADQSLLIKYYEPIYYLNIQKNTLQNFQKFFRQIDAIT